MKAASRFHCVVLTLFVFILLFALGCDEDSSSDDDGTVPDGDGVVADDDDDSSPTDGDTTDDDNDDVTEDGDDDPTDGDDDPTDGDDDPTDGDDDPTDGDDDPTDGDDHPTDGDDHPTDGDDDPTDGDDDPTDGDDDPTDGDDDLTDGDEETEEGETDVPEGYCDTNQCFPVPPTGQTACYNEMELIECPGEAGSETCGTTDFCGQDAQYPDNTRTFTCYNATGTETPCGDLPTASEDEVVTDSLIGLMWQRTWATNKTWQQALDYCDTLTYGGHSDWRLPNAHELRSLVDYGCINPSINTTAFPGTPSNSFWSSSTYVVLTNYAWYVTFDGGDVLNGIKPYSVNARCVRDGPVESGIGSLDHLVPSGEAGAEVVTDLVTGLVWQKTYAIEKTWQQALTTCEGLTYAGYSDWRLPNVNELASLVNYQRYNPASDFPGTPSSTFWSSSTCVGNAVSAWYMHFGNGYVYGHYKTYRSNARCVRGGP